jgi:predicted naringenin-chalcone synthase
MLEDIAVASPPYKVLQTKAAEELKIRMPGRPAIARLIDTVAVHSGIESRFIVIPDAEDSVENKFFTSEGIHFKPGTKLRMMEYEKWSKLLSEEAVKKLLIKTEFDPVKINRLITISCTGFFAPGLDLHLVNSFNLPLLVKRTNIGFMGCAASIIGFNSVLESMNSSNETENNTLLVSVELCSLHLQTEPTKDNILANLIFADGAAAALFTSHGKLKSNGRLKLFATQSIFFRDSEEYMGWKIGDFGFEMILSGELPKIILEQAVPAIKKILENFGLNANQVKYWALHPGGRAILDSLQSGLKLNDDDMLPSRTVLKNYGNMSSATILFVLENIISANVISPGEICCAVAFGPGLSMEVALLKGV